MLNVFIQPYLPSFSPQTNLVEIYGQFKNKMADAV